MRRLVSVVIFAITATNAMAAVPDSIKPSEKILDSPPLSIWQPIEDGGYRHLSSGLLCPATLGAYRRRSVERFDRFGLDVGCDYAGPAAGITYYLTRRVGSDLAAAMIEAKKEFLESGAARHPQVASDTNYRDGDIDWITTIYAGDGGLRDGIWVADLFGWTLEYRATYQASEEARVFGDIKAFATIVRESVGARLETCAKAPAADRHGKPITDKAAIASAAMMSSILGGAAQMASKQVNISEGSDLIACVDHAATIQGFPMVFSRLVRADGSDTLSDKVMAVSGGPPVVLTVSSGGLAGLLNEGSAKPGQPQQWTATFDRGAQTLIFGYFSGRPSFDQAGDLLAAMLSGKAKPVGGFSANGNSLNVIMPPK